MHRVAGVPFSRTVYELPVLNKSQVNVNVN